MYNEAVCQVTTLMTLLNGCLLKSVTDNSALAPATYEKFFLYCLAWGLGGLLDVKDRPALDTEFRSMSDQMPKKVGQTFCSNTCIADLITVVISTAPAAHKSCVVLPDQGAAT